MHCTDINIITDLIDAGAPIHSQMQRGNALYHATEFDINIDVVKVLIEQGVAVDENNMGSSPLCNAARQGNIDVCKILIENGAQLYTTAPMSALYIAHEKEIDALEKKNGNDDFIKDQRAIIAHNKPKSPLWYLENVKTSESIAKEIIKFAASKGQKPLL